MRFPLNQRGIAGYAFGSPTSYSPFHLGVDYRAGNGEPLYAPEGGQIIRLLPVSVAKQGGNTIWLKGESGFTYRFMHLQRFNVLPGEVVTEGKVIGWCDNTGLSSASHLHLDITKPGLSPNPTVPSQFVDPEKYNWGGGEFMTESETNDAYWDLSEAVYKAVFGRSLHQTEGDVGHWREVNEMKRLRTKLGSWFVAKFNSSEAQAYLRKNYGGGEALVGVLRKIKELVAPY